MILGHTRPTCDPAWVIGLCPACGGQLVVNDYWNREDGYRRHRECWLSLGLRPECGYRVRLDANVRLAACT